MDSHHAEVIANDEREVRDWSRRLSIAFKLAWYTISRPRMSGKIRARLLRLVPLLAHDPVFTRVDLFLNGEGGMFKQYAYRLCEKGRPIRGSSVLVPGIGYAKNLLQLAAMRPKEIVAFDLFDYPEVWAMMKEKIQKEYGIPVTFYKGDFDALPPERKGSFDFVVSDAVLEHVPDMPKFAAGSRDFLKPGGIFYASFGPLWYGPSGDHVTWGADKLFDHLLLSKEAYETQAREKQKTAVDKDSCDPGFMLQQDFFSYLKADQYLRDLDAAGFRILDLRAKIMPEAATLLASRSDIRAALDAKSAPLFDRFCGGMYVWAEKQETV